VQCEADTAVAGKIEQSSGRTEKRASRKSAPVCYATRLAVSSQPSARNFWLVARGIAYAA